MIVNCTPHDVNLHDRNNNVITYPRCTKAPRCATNRELQIVPEFEVDCPLFSISYGEVTDLPDQVEGTWLIVSGMLRNALPNRRDLISPVVITDAAGKVLGCSGFDTNL